ncbi:hypothetical protein OHB49_35995 [Streptomyces sp. NBC_01717]|uniref:hypothetical protein n=1 Tax=Streptomyces sp. NBC_01717 TaxID=2975918 RepID=UPI002E3796F1|nr:hypothetical protein [Streptomyces sp. NBC_01717]
MSNADRHGTIVQTGRESGRITVQELAHLLRRRPVTVLPLCLQAIHVLDQGSGPSTLKVPGGQPRPAEGAFTGPLTLASLAALRFDTAIMGCCGLSATEGLTAYDLDDAAVKKAAIASTRRIIVAADGGKLGHTAYVYVGPSTLLHTLVTDATASAGQSSRARRRRHRRQGRLMITHATAPLWSAG